MLDQPPIRKDLSRRRLLKMGAAAAGTLAATGCSPRALAAAIPAAPLRAPASPDEALQRLMAGNERFVSGQTHGDESRSIERLRSLSEKQTPFASVLGCADSRVPVEILFDQGLGDVFVCRAAGNIATSEIIGSLEYGTLLLGSQILMVLGHTACGAVTATVKGDAVAGQIGSLYPYIHPAAEDVPSGDLNAIIVQNVRNQVNLLRNASPVIKDLVAIGKLRVEGAVFDFQDGRVNLV
jgi:carbonic anhydrase